MMGGVEVHTNPMNSLNSPVIFLFIQTKPTDSELDNDDDDDDVACAAVDSQ